MPIFGRRKKRKAEEAATRELKDSATAGRPKYSMPGYGNRNGSGETKGNQSQSVQKREQQTPITPLETKKVTSIKGPTQKPQELKKQTIAEPPKPRLSLYQKDQLAKKNKTGKYAVKAKTTKDKSTKEESTKASKNASTYTDTRTPEQVDKGNARANFNRSNKSKAKPGETYKYKRASGEIVTITKGNKNKKGDKIPSPK
tara:strand:+ start:696 stop:1295 length:600 start_codon:yes stop_codon:yes gene_type:complete